MKIYHNRTYDRQKKERKVLREVGGTRQRQECGGLPEQTDLVGESKRRRTSWGVSRHTEVTGDLRCKRGPAGETSHRRGRVESGEE